MKKLIRKILKEEVDRSDIIYDKNGNVFKTVMKILDKKYRIYIPKYFKPSIGRGWDIEGIGEGGSRYGVSDWDVERFLGNELGFDDEQLEFLYKSWVIIFLDKHKEELDLNENDLEYYGVDDADPSNDEYKIGLKEDIPIYKEVNPHKKVFSRLKKQFPNTPDYVLQDFFRAQFIKSPKNLSMVIDQYDGDPIPAMGSYWHEFLNGPWKLELLNVNPDDFSDTTLNAFFEREFGEVDSYDVPYDEKRMRVQKSLAKGKGMNEPVIIVRDKNGKYELIEGWHRTMSALLLGDNGEDFVNWNKVKIRAFIKNA